MLPINPFIERITLGPAFWSNKYPIVQALNMADTYGSDAVYD